MGAGSVGRVVLLVDDSVADVDLTREAFAESALAGELHAVPDGVEALAFLRHEGVYHAAPPPDIVLLDLDMPRLDGRGVLMAVRQDPVLRHIPIVVFSSSNSAADVDAAYALAANCYVRKPVTLGEFVAAIRTLGQFWIHLAVLPSRRWN